MAPMVTAQHIEFARRQYVDAMGTEQESKRRAVLVELVEQARAQRAKR